MDSMDGIIHWLGFLCRWSYWAQNILIMPISAWKSQRRRYRGGLKKSGTLNERSHLKCQGMRVCWAGETRVGSKRKGRRLTFRKRKLNFYTICTVMYRLSLFCWKLQQKLIWNWFKWGAVDSKGWGVSLVHITEKSSQQLGLGLA